MSGTGPPPLEPFGLVLHHDGRWSHEGQPLQNRKLREHFDHSVQYLPDERKYIVTLRHFRGEIVLEEAGFFVQSVDLEQARIRLSDRTEERLDVQSLRVSPLDGALLCRVKRELAADGLDARFIHSAQAELMNAVEERGAAFGIRLAGEWVELPALD